jgi:DNA replication ATP-dependent helicase Dna2
MQKVLPREVSYYMMLGNIVNDLLDRLIKEPGLELRDFFPRVFQRNALQISQMEDNQVETLVSDIQRHYTNLKDVVRRGLPKVGISPDGCSLEPSFLSSKYGIQGRLDVLFQGDQTAIIELKSGKPFQPNEHGIKWDHYVQTLLYDLLLKSTGVSQDSRNFILYSSQSKDALRYAPPEVEVQRKSIVSRNQLVIIDALLRHPDIRVVEQVFKALLKEDLSRVSSFAVRDADRIRRVIAGCTRREWVYYLRFLVFIQNEVALAKLGQIDRIGRPGHAGLWLLSREQKHEEFNLLDGLRIRRIEESGQEVFINLAFTEKTNVMANFRNGDVVVLYPDGGSQAEILHHQVIKGSLIHIGGGEVVLRPRGSQIDRQYLLKWPKWTIERDVLDSSFKSMFDSLFYFLQSDRITKDLWLGLRPPGQPMSFRASDFSKDLLPDQVALVSRALKAQEYFLIWGPPGSGKTSRVISELVRQYFEQSDSDIYLLAYTNRAVDELASMVSELGEKIRQSATRLGSRFAAEDGAKEMMLTQQVAEVNDRKGLKALLEGKRVFLSTVASFWSQKDVVNAEGSNILIVDEASQILEPSIIGLLTFFDKVIFVGDHVQLPAVSQQSDRMGRIEEAELIEVGITQTKMSFFQRLYARCKDQGWEHAHGILRYQGRMHEEIMKVANTVFYDGQLRIIEGLERLSSQRSAKQVELQRLVFIDVEPDPARRMLKNSPGESDAIVRFLKNWLTVKEETIFDLKEDSIGIITPFRAQIALLRRAITEEWGEDGDKITIDTVERYQGSARDLIILSTSLHRESQLDSISSLDDEGRDRKFNVALTRAREQFVVVGPSEILRKSKAYSRFIEEAECIITERSDNEQT